MSSLRAAYNACTTNALPPAVPVHTPDDPLLTARLAQAGITLVACLCADWCGTCREYLPKFQALAQRLPNHVFVWIEIEDHPELTDDDDIENFPTLLVQDAGGIRFYGTMLPHIGHLEKFLDTLATGPSGPAMAGPDVLGMLREPASRP